MSLTLEDLEVLRESWDFEAKLAAGRDSRGTLPRDFWPTYSAMANTSGGRVVLGVKQNSDGSFTVRGIAEPEKVEQELWDLLNNRNKVSHNLLRRADVVRETLEGRTVLVIEIPRAERRQRPVHIDGDLFGGTYIRLKSGDHHAERDRVRRMVADSEPVARDSQVPEGYGIDDIHGHSLERYRNLLQAHRPGHPFLTEEKKNFLRQIGGWGVDRERGLEGPTLAGLLVFGEETAIRERYPYFHLDYRELPSEEESASRWTDRVVPDGTWNANLLEFYLRVIPKLHEQLRVPFRLGPDLFRKDETHAHEALREALVNTLIHADYTGRGGLRVFRSSRGFDFFNPGSLLLPFEQIRAGGQSECRNPGVQHIFRLVGLGERAGSGYPAILRAWREQHWRSPQLREDVERQETRLVLSLESLLPEGVMADLQKQFPRDFEDLDEGGRTVLATAALESPVDHARLSETTGLASRALTLLLQRLQRKGLLERVGRGRGCEYRLSSKTKATPSHESGSEHEVRGGPSSSEHKDGIISSSSDHLASSSDRLTPNSDHSDTEREGSLGERIARVREAGKVPRDQLEQAIIDLCEHDYVTLADLVRLLGRKQSTLRAHYLRPMLRNGRLELQYPETPNHPKQGYRAVKVEEDH